jgi:hypothetical protein
LESSSVSYRKRFKVFVNNKIAPYFVQLAARYVLALNQCLELGARYFMDGQLADTVQRVGQFHKQLCIAIRYCAYDFSCLDCQKY